MSNEGLKLSEVFTHFFAENVNARIESSYEVANCMKKLENAITLEGLPSAKIIELGHLNKLYINSLYSPICDEWNFPQFGDIYVNREGVVFLILTQECDLMSGEGRRPNIDRVLALEGKICDKEAEIDNKSTICKPYPIEKESSDKWVWWQLKKPVTLEVSRTSNSNKGNAQYICIVKGSSIKKNKYNYRRAKYLIRSKFFIERPINTTCLRKIYKLKFNEADQIQQAFAGYLTRVATEVQPPTIRNIKTELRIEKINEKIENLELYLLNQSNGNGYEYYLAIAPQSRSKCLTFKEAQVMSGKLIYNLSGFVAFNKFKEQLEKEKIYLGEEGEKPVMVKYINKPRGMKEWKVKI